MSSCCTQHDLPSRYTHQYIYIYIMFKCFPFCLYIQMYSSSIYIYIYIGVWTHVYRSIKFFLLKDEPSDVESDTDSKHWKSADLINTLKLHSETLAQEKKATAHSYTVKGGVTPSFAEGLLPPSSSIQLHVPRNNYSWHAWQVWYLNPYKRSKTFSYRGGTNSEHSLEQLKHALGWLWTEHCQYENTPAVKLNVYFLVSSSDFLCFLLHSYGHIYIYTYAHIY